MPVENKPFNIRWREGFNNSPFGMTLSFNVERVLTGGEKRKINLEGKVSKATNTEETPLTPEIFNPVIAPVDKPTLDEESTTSKELEGIKIPEEVKIGDETADEKLEDRSIETEKEEKREVASSQEVRKDEIHVVVKQDNSVHGEDRFFASKDGRIVAAFDGATLSPENGSHGGQVAQISRDALAEAAADLKDHPLTSVDEVKSFINESFDKANNRVRDFINKEIAQNPNADGASTGTIGYFVFEKDGSRKFVVGSVGDTRAYRVGADGVFELITQDDNILYQVLNSAKPLARKIQKIIDNAEKVEDLKIQGGRNFEEYFYNRGITDGIGFGSTISPKLSVVDLKEGDKIMLLTDGVYSKLTQREISQIVPPSGHSDEAAETMMAKAKGRSWENHFRSGVPDDATVIIADTVGKIKEDSEEVQDEHQDVETAEESEEILRLQNDKNEADIIQEETRQRYILARTKARSLLWARNSNLHEATQEYDLARNTNLDLTLKFRQKELEAETNLSPLQMQQELVETLVFEHEKEMGKLSQAEFEALSVKKDSPMGRWKVTELATSLRNRPKLRLIVGLGLNGLALATAAIGAIPLTATIIAARTGLRLYGNEALVRTGMDLWYDKRTTEGRQLSSLYKGDISEIQKMNLSQLQRIREKIYIS
ncbi:MAG TPA: PP2C family serine/threonine-protein phosphatase [Patescibacteria group bacterium]|nr:PP2C family serine/threonine-protein phosphatase [Patescibacteria group bacterium]